MRHYIIIIGAMKSGTTTLFDTLARHPAIAPASNKEPGFFAFDEVWSQGFDWFDTLFTFDPAQHRYRMEASTDYTKYPFVSGVWDRMTSREDVAVKLIYIMRHPLKRIESHARHVQRARKEIGQQISPRPDHGLDAGFSPVNLAASQYARQLDHFDIARQHGDLFTLTLEELQSAPDPVLRRLLTFLDLDPDAMDMSLPVSNAAANRTQLHPAWQTASRLRPLMAVGKTLLPNAMRDRIRGRFQQKVSVEGRFKLDEAETAFLESLYADDLRRLREFHKIDIKQHWSLLL